MTYKIFIKKEKLKMIIKILYIVLSVTLVCLLYNWAINFAILITVETDMNSKKMAGATLDWLTPIIVVNYIVVIIL